jgi:hypothetical protein
VSNLPLFCVISGLMQACASESSDRSLVMNRCTVLRSASQSRPVKGAALMASSPHSVPPKRGASRSLIVCSKGTPLDPCAIVNAALMASIHASHPAEFFKGGQS